MPISLTIFGVNRPGKDGHFCYALARSVRGAGEYPPPILPRDASPPNCVRVQLPPHELELTLWGTLLNGKVEAEFDSALSQGRLTVPRACPIEPGLVLTGTIFASSQVPECNNRLFCDGSGALWSSGFALKDGAARVVRYLRSVIGRQEIGEELECLLTKLDEFRRSGTAVSQWPLGIVERLRRTSAGHRPEFLSVHVIKPDARSQEPCRQAMVRRETAPLGQALRVHMILRSWNHIVLNKMIELPPGQDRVIVDAGSHVTDISFTAFDAQSGELLDQLEVSMMQSMHFGVVGRTTDDVLPNLFRGAPSSPDLIVRPRIRTSTFAGPSAGNRSGGFDDMRGNADIIETLIGRQTWRGECRFFSSGPEPQVEVIRWIKTHLEDTKVSRAFLVDPYLGADALKRVVARHGNESISLTVLVSPNVVDPDGPELDTPTSLDDHVKLLIEAANEMTDSLCGEICIINVKRGDGRRQAFHDRYFGLLDRDGVPSVFALSNSLNKAAGDWSFSVVEFDRKTSWAVAAYVDGLIKGNDRGRSIVATEVWHSPKAMEDIRVPDRPHPSGEQDFRMAIGKAYLALFDLEHRHVDRSAAADAIVEALISHWPKESTNSELIAGWIVDGMAGREQHAATIADRLYLRSPLAEVAGAIDSLLLRDLLDRLSPPDRSPHCLPAAERVDILTRAGRTISIREKATETIRDRLNATVEHYANALELGLFGQDTKCYDLLFAGLGLVVVGLQVAMSADHAKASHRVGLGCDYINLLGRFLRSLSCDELLNRPDDVDISFPGEEIAREACGLVYRLHEELGPGLEPAVERLRTDQFVADKFRIWALASRR